MSKYQALFEDDPAINAGGKYSALFEEEDLTKKPESESKYSALFENQETEQPTSEETLLDSQSTSPLDIQAFQPSNDLREKIQETPWYDAIQYEFEKFKHNLAFGAAEGVGDLYRGVSQLFGADPENPMSSEKPNSFRELSMFMLMANRPESEPVFTEKDFQESIVRPVSKYGVQLLPVGAGVSAVSKIPKLAKPLSKVPKAVKLPAGAAVTEFVALSADEEGISDMLKAGPLQKVEGESILMGKLKNAGEGLAALGGLKAVSKISEKTLLPVANKTFGIINKGLSNKYLQPLKTQIEEISPFVAGRLDKFELDVLSMKQVFSDRIRPFADQYKKFTKKEKQLFQRLTSKTESMPEAYKMLNRLQRDRKGMEGISQNFKEVTNSLDDLFKLANANGIPIEYRVDYLPRIMKNYDGFLKSLGKEPQTQIQKMMSDARKRKFDELPEQMKARSSVAEMPLTEDERAKVIQNYYEGIGRTGDGKASFQKQRVLPDINEKNQVYYEDFLSGLGRYVDSVTYRINKNKFLGKSNDPTARSIFKDVDRIEDADGQQKVTDLLNLRFKGGEQRVGNPTNVLRNAIYASTIANPYSTITQLGDLALNAYRNGLVDTVTPFGPKIKLKDFGLNQIASEFTDASAMKGAMDKLFTVTGFRKLDFALKENNLRSSFRSAQSMLRNKNSKSYKKFIEDNKPFFENETDDLVDAIRRGDLENENVRHYLFSRLTGTQPITLSEMPPAYLNMKKGRLAYALKTFFVKQLDIMRKDVIQKLSKKETSKEGVQNAIRFAMLFGGGTASINMAKDLILGRPIVIEDELMDTGLQTLGVSRYALKKGRHEGIGGTAAAIFLPPTPYIGEAFKVAVSDDKEKALKKQSGELLRYIPVVGKDIYWRVGPGKEKIAERKLDRLRGKD